MGLVGSFHGLPGGEAEKEELPGWPDTSLPLRKLTSLS